MGVTEGVEQRGETAVERAPSIPRYGISSPFKGHLSTKSNAFCLGSSSRLCDQYSIRDHMITHHKKIHSAKAAVDCSVPKSLLKSIKYSDQQRREKVKREVERFEKESLHSRSGSRPSSTSSRSSRSLLRDKDFYERNGQITRASPYSYHEELDSPSTYLPSPRNSGFLEDHVQLCRVANKRHPQVSRTTHRKHYELSSSPSEASASRSFSRFQDNYVKTYSGDLLDKHSEQFTNTHRPFTPRTLKTDAKSVLAQYRYYTPPRRKKKEDNEEAESQADVCSLLERSTKSQKKESLFLRDQDVQAKKEMFDDSEDERNSYSHFSENQIDWAKLSNHQRFFSRLSYNELKSPSPIMQKIQSEEEELVHLKFVTDITNEILSLGLFSNRVLERVFERHVAENKKNLDEGKMRHLLDTLRKDLGCKVTSMSNNNNKTSETEDKHLYLHTDGVGNEASQPQNVSYLEEWKAENLLQDDILQDVSDNSVDIDRLLAEDLEDDEREALKDKTSTPLSMPECDEDTEVIDKLDGLDGLEECFSEHLQLSKEEDCSAIGDVAESIASVTSRVIEEENDLD